LAKTIGAYKGLWNQVRPETDQPANAVQPARTAPDLMQPKSSTASAAAHVPTIDYQVSSTAVPNQVVASPASPAAPAPTAVPNQVVASTATHAPTADRNQVSSAAVPNQLASTSTHSQTSSKVAHKQVAVAPTPAQNQQVAQFTTAFYVQSVPAALAATQAAPASAATHDHRPPAAHEQSRAEESDNLQVPSIQESPELLAPRYRMLVLREHRIKLGRELLERGHRSPWAFAWSSLASLGRSFRPWAHARIFALGCFLGAEMTPDVLQQLRHPLWIGRYRRSMRGLWKLLELMAQKTGQKAESRFLFRLFYLCPPLGVLIFEKQLQSVLRKAQGQNPAVASGMVKATQGQ
jgi:hypothetical protein